MSSDSSLLDRPASAPSPTDARAAGNPPPTFAGYPLLEDLGPCPGGTAYRATHPSLRTPVVVRRYRPDWLSPADAVTAFVERARAAAPVVHSHLAHLLDAGDADGEPFAVLDPVDGADLFALVNDIGPMPTALAIAYVSQLAAAVDAAHVAGVVHGDVRPGTAFAGPLVPMAKSRADGTPRHRPGPNAAVTLCELGLVPRRPPAAFWAIAGVPISDDVAAFLPPERLGTGEPTKAGDAYGVGATAYFLLTGKPPFAADDSAALLDAVRTGTPVRLSALRPDVDPAVVDLVDALMAKDPAARPTAADAVSRLGGEPAVPTLSPAVAEVAPKLAVAEPESPAVPLEPAAAVVPLTTETPAEAAEPTVSPPVESNGPDPAAEPGTEPTSDIVPDAFPEFADHDETEDAEPAAEKATRVAPKAAPLDRKKLYLWLGIGVGLQLLAIVGWVVFAKLSDSSDPPAKPRNVPRKVPDRKGGGG